VLKRNAGEKRMAKDPLKIPSNLPPPPAHLSVTNRKLFVKIVATMLKAGVHVRKVDYPIISDLAFVIGLIRMARAGLEAGKNADVFTQSFTEQWTIAVKIAEEMKLSKADIETLLRDATKP